MLEGALRRQELGLESVPEGLDHAPKIAFLYGGVLTSTQLSSIHYVDHELGDSRSAHPDELAAIMVRRLAHRIAACTHHACTGSLAPLHLPAQNARATTSLFTAVVDHR